MVKDDCVSVDPRQDVKPSWPENFVYSVRRPPPPCGKQSSPPPHVHRYLMGSPLSLACRILSNHRSDAVIIIIIIIINTVTWHWDSLSCPSAASRCKGGESPRGQVLPGLYVGNYRDSKDAAQLERFQITHIVAIHDAARKLHSVVYMERTKESETAPRVLQDKHYLCVMASDTPDQNLTQYFSLCNDFIHAARLRGGNVLIHCLAGMSRSVTVAVAYIMSVTSLSWKEALKVVRVGRAVANPNFGFQHQLQEFESYRLAEERRRLKERFPSLALVAQDEQQCRAMLRSYQSLVLSRDICEGDCPRGTVCPTGLCNTPTKR
ncbi:dual specificity protein phosphatase 22 [Schistocerca americana]|uniref:dual specificity protein phosphatase 22 n=1 Tax=Schistocerca americana TaxID=7009 RepID=UPI001F4F7B90|nr:dual specificity protein phosphatase 22 [Schistocerca americana]